MVVFAQLELVTREHPELVLVLSVTLREVNYLPEIGSQALFAVWVDAVACTASALAS